MAKDVSPGTPVPARTPEGGVGMQDLWGVYEARYEEISDELRRKLSDHPEVGPLIQGMSEEESSRQARASFELTRRALLDGDWEPYLENVRLQGRAYAEAGLTFSTWFSVATEVRGVLTSRLLEAFGDSPERLRQAVAAANQLTDTGMAAIGEEYLATKQRTISRQQEAIRELSTPVLPLRPGLLILPLVGAIDSHRARQVTEQLLDAIGHHRAAVVVVDITGVPAVDSMVANHLIQTAQAARLMGASVIVTGISTVNAQTLVRIGIEPDSLNAVGDLQSGIEVAERLLARRPGEEGSERPNTSTG